MRSNASHAVSYIFPLPHAVFDQIFGLQLQLMNEVRIFKVFKIVGNS